MNSQLSQIGHLADVPIYMDVELARKSLTVRELLAIAKGAVIKMPRSAGENIDLLAGEAPFGSGEIVIIEETLGVRITDFKEEAES